MSNNVPSFPTRVCVKKTGPLEVHLIRIVVSKNKGERKTIPDKEAMISNARLTVRYVLRTKLATMPKMPLPNNIMVDGSGARERGFSVWSGLTVIVGRRVECCMDTVVSCGMIEDNAAPAVVTKKTLAASIVVVRAMLKILSLVAGRLPLGGCIGFLKFIVLIKKQIACQ